MASTPKPKKPAAKAAPAKKTPAAKKAAPKADEKHAGGRPTLYRPEYCQQLLEYFDIEPTTIESRTVIQKDGTAVTVDMKVPNDLPTMAGFCCRIGVHRETLLNWSKAHPEFFDSIKHAKEHQERILVSNGITGFYDKTFAIFTAKNLINWRDKQEIEHDVKPESPLASLLGSIAGKALAVKHDPDE